MALRAFAEGDLFAEVYGQGPPLVLALHGWGRRGADFKQSFHDLPALAPDLPGFGASPPPSGSIGAEGYADIVVEMLTAFDGPPVLVGHSFGGRVAVCLAARFPDLVGALVLTGVPLLRTGPVKRPSPGYRVMRNLNRLGLVSEARMEAERQKRGSADYKAASGVMRDILIKAVNETYESQMAGLGGTVKLLWGRQDAEVPVSVAERAMTMMPTASLEVLEGVGHHVPMQAPSDLRRVVDTVLS